MKYIKEPIIYFVTSYTFKIEQGKIEAIGNFKTLSTDSRFIELFGNEGNKNNLTKSILIYYNT